MVFNLVVFKEKSYSYFAEILNLTLPVDAAKDASHKPSSIETSLHKFHMQTSAPRELIDGKLGHTKFQFIVFFSLNRLT